MLYGSAVQSLELGEGALDKVEVRAIRLQIQKRPACCLDYLSESYFFVARQIVHDDDGFGGRSEISTFSR
jgi:hypothetical protein